MLYGAGWPVLPWQLVFERRHDDYLRALHDSLIRRSYRPIVQFVHDVASQALATGLRMLDILPQERTRLEFAIAQGEFLGSSKAREYADALLGQVLVEGFGWNLHNDRQMLRALHEQGLIDRIRTPAGAVFSSPVARRLLR
jgi:hypothetical protein